MSSDNGIIWQRINNESVRVKILKERTETLILGIESHPYRDFNFLNVSAKRFRMYQKDFRETFKEEGSSGIYYCTADEFEKLFRKVGPENVRMRNAVRDLDWDRY